MRHFDKSIIINKKISLKIQNLLVDKPQGRKCRELKI